MPTELVFQNILGALDGRLERCWIVIVLSRENDGVSTCTDGGLGHLRALPRQVDLNTEMSDTRSNHAPERSLGMVDVSAPTGEDNDEELCPLEVQVCTAAAMSSVRAVDMASSGHVYVF